MAKTKQGSIPIKVLPVILLIGTIALTTVLLGQKTGWFNQASETNTRSFRQALKFPENNKTNYIKYSNPPAKIAPGKTSGYTIEMWIKLPTNFPSPNNKEFPIIRLIGTNSQGKQYNLINFYVGTGMLDNGTIVPTPWTTTATTIDNVGIFTGDNVDLTPGAWNHLALELKQQENLCYSALYVNGKSTGIIKTDYGNTQPCQFAPKSALTSLLISSKPETNDQNSIQVKPYQGLIDELRISNIARYNPEFNEANLSFNPPNSPFTNDTNTLALWHFNNNLTEATNSLVSPKIYGSIGYADSNIPQY